MKVNEILSNGKITLSFEVFPPKTDAQFESVRQATIDVAALKPSYMEQAETQERILLQLQKGFRIQLA